MTCKSLVKPAACIMATLLAWSFMTTHGSADEKSESVEVRGGQSSRDIDVKLSMNTRTPGRAGGSGRTTRPGAAKSGAAKPASSAPVPKPYSLSELSLRSDARGRSGPNLEGVEGTWCTATVIRTSATPFAQTRVQRTATRNRQVRDLGYPACSALPSEVAKELILKVTLPTPVLEIDPGWAITGLAAYLETKGAVTYDSGPVETEWGTMTMHGTGEYYVDWGDNTGQQGPYGFEGMAWPDGRITHVYRDTGVYTVTVRQLWTVQWQVAQRSGVLQDRFTESTLTLPVRELQAVRIR